MTGHGAPTSARKGNSRAKTAEKAAASTPSPHTERAPSDTRGTPPALCQRGLRWSLETRLLQPQSRLQLSPAAAPRECAPGCGRPREPSIPKCSALTHHNFQVTTPLCHPAVRRLVTFTHSSSTDRTCTTASNCSLHRRAPRTLRHRKMSRPTDTRTRTLDFRARGEAGKGAETELESLVGSQGAPGRESCVFWADLSSEHVTLFRDQQGGRCGSRQATGGGQAQEAPLSASPGRRPHGLHSGGPGWAQSPPHSAFASAKGARQWGSCDTHSLLVHQDHPQ